MKKGMVDPGESSKGAYRMRVASGGSIQHYVAFALQFLKDHPDRPLVLHTIPPPLSSSKDGATEAEAEKPGKASPSLPRSLLATPKLISVVELIKRQYMINLEASLNGKKGKNKAMGIWQYTTSGCLPIEPTNGRAPPASLETVLAGRTQPALRHSPYIEITLSTRPLGLEDQQKDTTCQYVMLRNRRSRKPETGEAKAGTQDVSAAMKLKEAGGAMGEQLPPTIGQASGESIGKAVDKPAGITKKRKADPTPTPPSQPKAAKKAKSKG